MQQINVQQKFQSNFLSINRKSKLILGFQSKLIVTNHNFGALLKIEIIKSIFASSSKNCSEVKLTKK